MLFIALFQVAKLNAPPSSISSVLIWHNRGESENLYLFCIFTDTELNVDILASCCMHCNFVMHPQIKSPVST